MPRWFALLLVMFLHIAGIVDACSCSVRTLCERLDSTPVVFLGEVISGGVSPGENRWRNSAPSARVKVIEAFRGISAATREMEVKLFFIPGMCAASPYVRGKRVLVFADFEEGRRTLTEGPCTESVFDDSIPDELETVRRYFRGQMKTRIYGRVAPNVDADSVDFALSQNYVLPLPGATVVAEARGKRYQEVSDATGAYSINGLPAGEYQMHAQMDSYEDRDGTVTVRVKKGGCALANFALGTKNSVEGSIMDARGAPVSGLHVFLQQEGLMRQFGEQATTGVRGDFRFTQINPGRHSVVVSPAGETADSPYPRTAASLIEVGPDTAVRGVTLIVPPAIPTRNIHIYVSGADGKPLRDGSITCAQAGKEKEGYPMSQGLRAEPNGATCRALADRPYRVQLVHAGDSRRPLADPPEAIVAAGGEHVAVYLKVR